MKKIQSIDKRCPECQNLLQYWVSDDYYNKGHKFYSCEVCGWEPKKQEQAEPTFRVISDSSIPEDTLEVHSANKVYRFKILRSNP